MWDHLTWPGDLTLRDLGMKFSQHMRKRCIIRYVKNGDARRRCLMVIWKKGGGLSRAPPPSGRGLCLVGKGSHPSSWPGGLSIPSISTKLTGYVRNRCQYRCANFGCTTRHDFYAIRSEIISSALTRRLTHSAAAGGWRGGPAAARWTRALPWGLFGHPLPQVFRRYLKNGGAERHHFRHAWSYVHLFRTCFENFRPRSLKVRSPDHVKWPHLRKSLNARHSCTKAPINLKLSAIDSCDSI